MTTQGSNQKKIELTVADILRWLSKLEKLTSEGAKVVHTKHLLERALEAQRQELRKQIEELPFEVKFSSGDSRTSPTAYIKRAYVFNLIDKSKIEGGDK